MWTTLALQHTYQCHKTCPFCYLRQEPGSDLPVDFFSRLLCLAAGVKLWYFSWNYCSAEKIKDGIQLVHLAWKLNHPYALTTNYENVFRTDPDIFRKSRLVAFSLDEYKVTPKDWPFFFQTLAWCRKMDLPTAISITLTPFMLRQLLTSDLLEKVLNLTGKVYLLVPKSPDYPYLQRAEFDPLLNKIFGRIVRADVFAKIELDHCLLPTLPPWQSLIAPECAYEKVLSIMPDGSLKICPYGKPIGYLQSPQDIEHWLNLAVSPYMQSSLMHCCWREDWQVHEEVSAYGRRS